MADSKTPHIYSLPREQVMTIYTNELSKDADDEASPYHKYMNKYHKRMAVAPLPETVSVTMANKIDQTWSFMQSVGKLAKTATFFGVNVDKGYSERTYWTAIEAQEMTFELEFTAYYSGKIDVIYPTQRLIALAAPVESDLLGTWSKAVGKVDEYWTKPATADIFIGKYLRLRGVIVKSVTVNYSNKLDDNFDPMFATASITVVNVNPKGFIGWVKAYHTIDESGQQPHEYFGEL